MCVCVQTGDIHMHVGYSWALLWLIISSNKASVAVCVEPAGSCCEHLLSQGSWKYTPKTHNKTHTNKENNYSESVCVLAGCHKSANNSQIFFCFLFVTPQTPESLNNEHYHELYAHMLLLIYNIICVIIRRLHLRAHLSVMGHFEAGGFGLLPLLSHLANKEGAWEELWHLNTWVNKNNTLWTKVCRHPNIAALCDSVLCDCDTMFINAAPTACAQSSSVRSSVMLVIRSGSQSVCQFILKVLDGAEVRALCRPVKSFHTKLGKPLKQERDKHKLLTQRWKNTFFLKISLCAAELRYKWTVSSTWSVWGYCTVNIFTFKIQKLKLNGCGWM